MPSICRKPPRTIAHMFYAESYMLIKWSKITLQYLNHLNPASIKDLEHQEKVPLRQTTKGLESAFSILWMIFEE